MVSVLYHVWPQRYLKLEAGEVSSVLIHNVSNGGEAIADALRYTLIKADQPPEDPLIAYWRDQAELYRALNAAMEQKYRDMAARIAELEALLGGRGL